jgi:hypothetical protein
MTFVLKVMDLRKCDCCEFSRPEIHYADGDMRETK